MIKYQCTICTSTYNTQTEAYDCYNRCCKKCLHQTAPTCSITQDPKTEDYFISKMCSLCNQELDYINLKDIPSSTLIEVCSLIFPKV